MPPIVGPYSIKVRDYMFLHGTGDDLDALELGDWIKSWWQPGLDSSPVLYDMLVKYEVPRVTINGAYARAGLPVPVGSTVMTFFETPGFQVWRVLATLSLGACAYHGYKRHSAGNHPIAWAVGWGITGSIFGPFAAGVALAQGFGKPMKGNLSGARYRRRLR